MIFQTNLHFISETRCLQRSMRTPTENTWHFALVPQNEYVINGVWIAMDCILSSPCNKFAEQMTLLAQLLSPVTFVYQIVVVNRRKWKRFVTLNFSFKRMTQFISTYSTIHVEWFMNWHISIYISEVCRFCADAGANCATWMANNGEWVVRMTAELHAQQRIIYFGFIAASIWCNIIGFWQSHTTRRSIEAIISESHKNGGNDDNTEWHLACFVVSYTTKTTHIA